MGFVGRSLIMAQCSTIGRGKSLSSSSLCPGDHPAYYLLDSGEYFPGNKRSEPEAEPPIIPRLKQSGAMSALQHID
jgi:hypothetical protein